MPNRKIIVSEFLSLDGIFEEPGVWSMSYVNDEFLKFKGAELKAADALLLGRLTYEGFAKAWPNMKNSGDYGVKMNGMQKYVVSKTLKKAEWNNSTIIKENAISELAQLKQQPGQDILVFGSGVLFRALMASRLVDELRLLVYPLVLGSGKRLFKEESRATLELLEAKAMGNGAVLLRYQPAAGAENAPGD